MEFDTFTFHSHCAFVSWLSTGYEIPLRIYIKLDEDTLNRYSDMSITRDSNAQSLAIAKQGDMIGYYGSNYLEALYFYVRALPAMYNYGSPFAVIGNIVDSLPLVLDLNENETKDIVISDCGIIIENQ